MRSRDSDRQEDLQVSFSAVPAFHIPVRPPVASVLRPPFLYSGIITLSVPLQYGPRAYFVAPIFDAIFGGLGEFSARR